MTTEDLKKDWEKYAVVIDGNTKPLEDVFMLCLGYDPSIPDALVFDTGGPQGAPAYTLKVGEEDHLIAVNPEDPTETSVLGKLIHLG